jgi:hypothetical protein
MRMTHSSAKKDGFGRPFFCHVLSVCWFGALAFPAHAQEAIYRCGQEYTNSPQIRTDCVPIQTVPAVTVIEGTRPSAGASAGRTTSASGTALVPSQRTKADLFVELPAAQRERDVQARAILLQELAQARQQQAQLQQVLKDSETAKQADKTPTVKAALERTQRDIDSLQRELARRPMAANP